MVVGSYVSGVPGRTGSEVIGEGALAHRRVAVGLWAFTVPGAEGTEPLIRDLDARRHPPGQLSLSGVEPPRSN